MLNKNWCLRVGAVALTLLFFGACGSDKNLSPYSQLFFDGPYPTNVVADVDPAYDRIEYFEFHIELEDPNLSIVASQDAWTVDGVTGSYSIDDPGAHILAPLPDVNMTNSLTVTSASRARYVIQILTKDWLETNAQGLVGTTDTATVTLTGTFTAHRNRDGIQRSFPFTFSFVLQDMT